MPIMSGRHHLDLIVDHGTWLEEPRGRADLQPDGSWLVIKNGQRSVVGLREFAINALAQPNQENECPAPTTD